MQCNAYVLQSSVRECTSFTVVRFSLASMFIIMYKNLASRQRSHYTDWTADLTSQKSWFDSGRGKKYMCSPKRHQLSPDLIFHGYWGLFPRLKCPRRETDHQLHPGPRIRLSGAVFPLPHVPLCRAQGVQTRWCSWLKHCAASQNVAASIPDGIT